MHILKAKTRNANSKGNQLRREGIIPAVLYGKQLEKSIIIQIPQKEVEHFLRSNSVGYKLDLIIDGEKHMALLKEVIYSPADIKLEHLCFQELIAGEMVTSSVQFVLINKEKVDGVVHQLLNEISYRALPSDLIEKIEIDLDGKEVGYSVSIADLEISKNKAIEILSPPESLVVSISAHKEFVEETPESEEGKQSIGSNEVPLVNEKDKA